MYFWHGCFLGLSSSVNGIPVRCIYGHKRLSEFIPDELSGVWFYIELHFKYIIRTQNTEPIKTQVDQDYIYEGIMEG